LDVVDCWYPLGESSTGSEPEMVLISLIEYVKASELVIELAFLLVQTNTLKLSAHFVVATLLLKEHLFNAWELL
jgi:hypothetical protein